MNARIDHSNYEAWLLDRLEGTLTPNQERELDAFLHLHPELAEVDDSLPTVGELSDALTKADKAALKRNLPPIGLVREPSVDDHLIARLEGDLTAEQDEALRVFLASNRQWHRAERLYTLTKLVPAAVAYPEKELLRRSIPPQGVPVPHTVHDFLIARAEGDLSAEQNRALDRILYDNTHLQREWALVKAARLAPEPVFFVGKATLKKKEGRVIALSSQRWAAAASVALLLALGVWYLGIPDNQVERFARVPVPKHQQGGAPHQVAHGVQAHTPTDNAEAPPLGMAQQPAASELEVLGAPFKKGSGRPGQPPAEARASEISNIPVQDFEVAAAVVLEPSAEEPIETPAPTTEDVEEPWAQTTPATVSKHVQHGSQDRTVTKVLTGVLRERVLDAPARDTAPLDGDDAVAAVDRTLKVVAGRVAGLDLQRETNGVAKGFHLRLGRNLSISAQR